MRKKLIFGIFTVLIVFCVCAMPVNAFAESEVLSVYEIDFSTATAEKVNADFVAAFTMENGYPRFESVNQEEGGHWFLENGALTRKNDIYAEGGGSTTRVAVLTYKKKLFTNFRATVVYKQGSTTWGWSAFAFRQLDEGMTAADDGAYCFVQGGGQATIWGRYCGSYSALESDSDSSYDKSLKHTMTVEVIGNDINLYVDGILKKTHVLPSSFYYEGYISLLSLDNDSYFYSLKVEELTEPERAEKPRIEPVPSANTDDCLDVAAEKKSYESLQERPISNSGASADKKDQKKGCVGSVSCGLGTFVLLPIIFSMKKRKK